MQQRAEKLFQRLPNIFIPVPTNPLDNAISLQSRSGFAQPIGCRSNFPAGRAINNA
jgi:hypothetical protein